MEDQPTAAPTWREKTIGFFQTTERYQNATEDQREHLHKFIADASDKIAAGVIEPAPNGVYSIGCPAPYPCDCPPNFARFGLCKRDTPNDNNATV